MHAFLLALLALAADSNVTPHDQMADSKIPASEFYSGEPAGGDVLLPVVERAVPALRASGALVPASAAGARPRGSRAPRLLPLRHPASQQYYRSRPYDPRLMFDYPWHPPRVVQPVYPVFPQGHMEPLF